MSETVINVTRVSSANGHHPSNGVDEQGSNLSWIQFNIEYFMTHDGILKLVQLVSKECVIKNNLIVQNYKESNICSQNISSSTPTLIKII